MTTPHWRDALKRGSAAPATATTQAPAPKPSENGRQDRPTLSLAGETALTVDDFYAVMPTHSYIFVPSREMWPAASVNSRIAPIATGRTKKDGEAEYVAAARWLDEHRPVEQLTWAPGDPMLIGDRIISEGGWIDRPGCRCFNLYRPSPHHLGDAAAAERWLAHVGRVYGDDAQHIIYWLAHRVQRPGEKLNHALVLGGNQGIGKDTLLEPVKRAIGPWNFVEVSPVQMLGRFNGFAKSVILRISEARDLGETDRFAFYDHLKLYTAAPPDVIRCDEKNLREHYVPNVCGVIITTNHKTDGIYLPPDDRRHFVAWSEKTKEDFSEEYWKGMWGWYSAGGYGHVAAYLATLDLSEFNAKAPPPKTRAFLDIVDAHRSSEDAELADALDALSEINPVTKKSERPKALTIETIREDIRARLRNSVTADSASRDLLEWLNAREHRKRIPHRLEAAGYIPHRNADAADGLWKVDGKRQVIYVRKDLSYVEQCAAAQKLLPGGAT